MKNLGLTLVATLVFSTSAFAGGNSSNNVNKWNGHINNEKLNTYLKLRADQEEHVATICDYLKEELRDANGSKKNKNVKLRKAIYGNLKLMKQTLDKDQYISYVRILDTTLRNKGIKLD